MGENLMNTIVFALTVTFTALGMEHVQVLLFLFDLSALCC